MRWDEVQPLINPFLFPYVTVNIKISDCRSNKHKQIEDVTFGFGEIVLAFLTAV